MKIKQIILIPLLLVVGLSSCSLNDSTSTSGDSVSTSTSDDSNLFSISQVLNFFQGNGKLNTNFSGLDGGTYTCKTSFIEEGWYSERSGDGTSHDYSLNGGYIGLDGTQAPVAGTYEFGLDGNSDFELGNKVSDDNNPYHYSYTLLDLANNIDLVGPAFTRTSKKTSFEMIASSGNKEAFDLVLKSLGMYEMAKANEENITISKLDVTYITKSTTVDSITSLSLLSLTFKSYFNLAGKTFVFATSMLSGVGSTKCAIIEDYIASL